ncbi:ATP-binding protein [Haloglomus salinum]|uniref:ATP-binding protein n=1 Tax=Haloglomus salinum TaxID=2962673 RepID=UPI0020C94884|nr:ATP-binding protein [Haloglomus salinum]
MSETRPTDDIPDDFVRENRQHVRTLVESLVAMEGTADREAVDEAFRAAHSLKANCELAGLDDAGAVAHAVEDVLAAARAGHATVDEATADEAAAAVEAIERVIDAISDEDAIPAIDVDGWTTRLRSQLGDSEAVAADTAAATPDGQTGTAPDADDEAAAAGADPVPDLDDLDLDEEAQAALEAAGDYDDLDALVAAMDDEAEAYADLEGGGSFDAVEEAQASTELPEPDPQRTATHDEDAVGAGGSEGGDERGDAPAEMKPDTPVESTADRPDLPAPDPDLAPSTPGTRDAGSGASGPTDGVTVPGVGQVTDAAATIAESSLDAEQFGIDDDEAAEDAAAPEPLGAARSLAVEGRRLAAALDEGDLDGQAADALASLRTAADALGGAAAGDLRRLDALAPDLKRAVERATRHVETPVELDADLPPVALDRTVVDRLSEPLVHCVRNAIDHGIEEPRERGAAGKPEAGTVTVRGRRDGERLVVTVEDDGRGIDAEAVREAAVETGIEGAAGVTDDEALDLLFEAGLSTADASSDLSGRGVGMDVVGRAMADLEGEVTVDSTPGEGTTVRLSVPVGSGVERVRVVAVGGETYAVPEWPLEETVPASEARVQNGSIRVAAPELEQDAMGIETAFGSTVDYRVVDLVVALGVPEAAADGADEHDGQREPAYLLVDPPDGAGGRDRDGHVALRCDGVLSEHETLVTPLADVDANPAVDGVVVCDAGRVVPVLDPTAFVGGR